MPLGSLSPLVLVVADQLELAQDGESANYSKQQDERSVSLSIHLNRADSSEIRMRSGEVHLLLAVPVSAIVCFVLSRLARAAVLGNLEQLITRPLSALFACVVVLTPRL